MYIVSRRSFSWLIYRDQSLAFIEHVAGKDFRLPTFTNVTNIFLHSGRMTTMHAWRIASSRCDCKKERCQRFFSGVPFAWNTKIARQIDARRISQTLESLLCAPAVSLLSHVPPPPPPPLPPSVFILLTRARADYFCSRMNLHETS